jgi:hypothetical protein
MTPYGKVYEAFLARILEDEWDSWLIEEAEQDWRLIMEAAIPWFKFPRVSLERNEEGFVEKLGTEEIQIIANFMKCEWLNRCILTWENVKPLYNEKDFSQANLLDKLQNLLEGERAKAEELESIYYRSKKGRPFNFASLATKIGN